MERAEAGRLGGIKRREAIGGAGFAALGKVGGATTRERHGKEHFAAIGSKGGAAARAGHPRKKQSDTGGTRSPRSGIAPHPQSAEPHLIWSLGERWEARPEDGNFLCEVEECKRRAVWYLLCLEGERDGRIFCCDAHLKWLED